jgi:hypothetical protein
MDTCLLPDDDILNFCTVCNMYGCLPEFVRQFVRLGTVQPGTTTSFYVPSNISMIRLALEFRA